MKPLLLLFLMSMVSLCAGEPPWPRVPYREVRAFAWDPAKTPNIDEQVIRADMSFVEGVIDKEGVVLNADQVKRLLKAETHRFADRPVAGCYMPHNAFVFYNADKKPVAFLEVCFDCLGARTNPVDANCDPDFYALAKICAELRIPFGRHKSVEDFEKGAAEILGPPPGAEPANGTKKAKQK